MRKFTLGLSLILLVVTLAACSSTTAVVPEVVEVIPSEPVLEIVGLEETVSLTMTELMALTAIEGWGGTISSAGIITPPQRLEGIPLILLTELVGGLEPGMGVNVVAKLREISSPMIQGRGTRFQLMDRFRLFWLSSAMANLFHLLMMDPCAFSSLATRMIILSMGIGRSNGLIRSGSNRCQRNGR